MKNKLTTSLLLLFTTSLVLLNTSTLSSQCLSNTWTTTFDYQSINTKTFTWPGTGSNQTRFQYSALNICNELALLSKNKPFGTVKLIGSVNGNIKIRAQKISYTPFQVMVNGQSFPLRMIFVRPDDNVDRPCILLSPGGGADFNNWYNYLALGVADYVSRGYSVAFFENYNNKYVLNAIGTGCAIPQSTNMPVFTDPELPFYGLYQLANAAAKYIVGNAATLHVNTNKLFAGGNSAGGFSAYSLAFSSANNFTNPVFGNALGSRNSKTFPAYQNLNYDIKGIGILGSGLFPSTAKMGNLIDASDADVTAVLWHGSEDALIHPTCCPNTPCASDCPDNGLQICGAITVGEQIQAVGGHPYVYLNCPGGHTVVEVLLTPAQASGVTVGLPTLALNPDLLNKINKETQQMMAIQRGIAQEFKKVVAGTPQGTGNSLVFKPQDSPNVLGANWMLCTIPASGCTSGNISEQDPLTDRTTSGEMLATGGYTAFPNPSSGQIMLRGDLAEQITVYDVMGKEVQTISEPGQNFTIQINLLQKGIYWVSFFNAGKVHTTRVVVH